MEQDLATMDASKLHPLSPEVISRQATINIGALLSLSDIERDSRSWRACRLPSEGRRFRRDHRSRGSREIDCGESDFGSAGERRESPS